MARVEPTPRKRRLSLKARVVASTLLVALGPQTLVFLWSQVDRPTTGRLWGAVRDVVEAIAPVVDDDDALRNVAEAKRAWLRIEGPGRRFDADLDDPHEPFERVEAFFLRGWELDDVRSADARAGPLEERWQAQEAKKQGIYIGCDFRGLVFCEAFRWVPARDGRMLLVVATSSLRPWFELSFWLGFLNARRHMSVERTPQSGTRQHPHRAKGGDDRENGSDDLSVGTRSSVVGACPKDVTRDDHKTPTSCSRRENSPPGSEAITRAHQSDAADRERELARLRRG